MDRALGWVNGYRELRGLEPLDQLPQTEDPIADALNARWVQGTLQTNTFNGIVVIEKIPDYIHATYRKDL